MAGSANSRHGRDRGPSRRDRDRDDRDPLDLMPYDDEPRGRDKRPAPSRRSTYNDANGSAEYYEDDDRYYPPRSSDHRSKRQGRGGRRPHSEPRSRSAHGGHDERRDRDRSVDNKKKRNQMIKAGLSAAAFEAFRQKNRPGDWVGEKGFRVATAAISAAVIDAGIDKNPNHGAIGNILKSTVGGLVFDKIANGGKR